MEFDGVTLGTIESLLTEMRAGFAYLDPGSGSYLLQLLIAGVLGALFLLRGYWGRVKNSILRLIRRAPEETEGSDDRE
jgi:hypothetical protein